MACGDGIQPPVVDHECPRARTLQVPLGSLRYKRNTPWFTLRCNRVIATEAAMATECIETQEWIEEEVSKPVEEWVEQTEKKCKKRHWYDPRRWLCWLVTTLVKVVVWVVVTLGK